MAGKLPNFTGIDSPYEPPETPELHIATAGRTPQECAALVLDAIRHRVIG
jgi:bifunctional enzyme CysN/CysC